MKTYLLFWCYLTLPYFGFSQLNASFESIKDQNAIVLNPMDNIDPATRDIHVIITGIPPDQISRLAEKLFVVDSIRGSQSLRIRGDVLESTKLKFDLTNIVGRMTPPLVKKIYIKDGANIWATFDMKLKEEASAENDPSACNISQTQFQIDANAFVNNKIMALKLEQKDGVWIDSKKIVHIFIDHYGNQYGLGIPTSAKEDYRYQVHLVTSNCHTGKFNFYFSYSGTYDPQFNIFNATEDKKTVTPQSAREIEYTTLDYTVIGPFTREFTIKIDREDAPAGSNRKTILDAKVIVAKRYYVSISTGLFGTTLKNPSNIEEYTLPSGQTTLIADDDNDVRGVLTVMATFYPQGRSFLFPPKGTLFGPERLGFVVGAQLSDDLEENFFGGIAFDISRGCSFTTGAHFGRRNFVAGHKDFKFGEDIFSGDLTVKKEWAVGLYFGLIVDMRVVGQLFPALSGQ